MDKYRIIIDLPHFEPKSHPRMSMSSRSAQFSPFAALTGYGDLVSDTERQTDKKIILSDDEKARINSIIVRLRPGVTNIRITYFSADKTKKGGKYTTVKGIFKQIDDIERTLKLTSGTLVRIDDISDIKIKGED